MYSGTREVAQRLRVVGPVACIDGSHIVDASTDADLACHSLTRPAIARTTAILREAGATAVVFSRDAIWFDDASRKHLPFLTVWSDRREQVSDVLTDPRWGEDSCPVTAVVAIAPAGRLTAARERILGEVRGDAQAILFMVDREGNAGMVLRAAGVTKGTALEWIARHYDVDPAEVVAVGDWMNDIPMLRAAGRSFCMAQSPPELVAPAGELLEADGWSGGGFAEAAARAGLL